MKNSIKMMWGCAALLGLVVILAAAGVDVAYAALFAIPCLLMMGGMMWMMMRGMGGGSHHGESK